MAEALEPAEKTRPEQRVGDLAGARFMSLLQDMEMEPNTRVDILEAEAYEEALYAAASAVEDALKAAYRIDVQVRYYPYSDGRGATITVLARARSGYWVLVHEEHGFMGETLRPGEVAGLAERAAKELSKAIPLLSRC